MDSALDARFWRRVMKDASTDGCWLWTGPKYVEGYGRLWAEGDRYIRAHRYAWSMVNGPIPEGLRVLHKCDNPPCVNPDHLFVGTQADNVRDMILKGRARYVGPPSERAPRAKLNPENVLEILRLRAEGTKILDLAHMFGVSRGAIEDVVARKTWKNICTPILR